jgi:hypothetical protein
MPVVAFSFGNAKRRNLPLTLVGDTSLNQTLLSNPGPGSYSASQTNNRYKQIFGSSKRKEENAELKKVPGPGVY